MGSLGLDDCANLKSISLVKLLAGDAETVNDLVQACKEIGFFYLDFRSPSTSQALQQVDALTDVGKAVFGLSLEEKEAYSTEKYLPSRLLGYLPMFGDYEGFIVLKLRLVINELDVQLGHSRRRGMDAMIVPPAIEENLPLVTAFMANIHEYTDCILSTISREIHLGRDLKDCHRKDQPSTANMAMLNYLPWGSNDQMIGNMAHTDMGTLTVVFTKFPGLQVLLPGVEGWSYIPPREGHAVVNVGDSLRFLSGGVLTSSLHRVVPPPEGVAKNKFSVIYFLRPELDAKFTTQEGKEINSVEWHNQKYALFREASLDATQNGFMLTGRQGYLGATGN